MAEWRDLSRLGWVAAAMVQGDRIVGTHLLKTRESPAAPSIEGLRANGFIRRQNGEWVTGRTDVRWQAVFPALHPLFDRPRSTPSRRDPIAATIIERAETLSEDRDDGHDLVFGSMADQPVSDFNQRALRRLIGTTSDPEHDAMVLGERILEALPESEQSTSADTVNDWAVVIRAAMANADAIVVSDVAGRSFMPQFTLARADLILSGEVTPQRHIDSDAAEAREALQRALLDRTSEIRGALLRDGWERSETVVGSVEKQGADRRTYRLGFDLTMSRVERVSPPTEAHNFNLMLDIVTEDGAVEQLADLPHAFDADVGEIVSAINEHVQSEAVTESAEIAAVRTLIRATGHAGYEAAIVGAIESAGGYSLWAADRANQDVADSLMNQRLLNIRNAFYRLNESEQLAAGWARLENDPSIVEFGTDAGRYRVSVDTSLSAVPYNITNFALKLHQVDLQGDGGTRWPVVRTVANDLQLDADAIVAGVWSEVGSLEKARAVPATSVGVDGGDVQADVRRGGAERIEDVGEKIGGARKDKYQGFGDFYFQDFALKSDEIDALFDYKKIWPFSVTSIRDNDGDALAAAEIKSLRARVKSPSEVLRRVKLSVRDYVNAVERVRDAYASVNTHDEFMSATRKLREWCDSDEAWTEESPTRRRATTDYMALDALLGGAERTLRLNYSTWKSTSPDKFALLQRAYRFTDEDGRPRNDEAAWKWLLPTRVRPKTEVVDGQPELPTDRDLVSEKYEREGVDWRDGNDVTPDVLLNEFGFRGIEFGNWVGQRERQEVINAAYDSFCDMAEVLGIDRRQVGFDGKLGLAFGARGQGKAAAHYEPSFNVINLTKTRGAGFLAHEWGHALDRLAGQAHKAYASEHSIAFPGEGNPHWLARKADLADADDRTLARYQASVEGKLNRSKEVVVSWVSGLLDRRARILTGSIQWGEGKARATQIYEDALAAADEFRDTATESERERAFNAALNGFLRQEVPLSDEALKKADAAHVRDLKKTEKDAWKNIDLAFGSRERHFPQFKLFSMTRGEIREELARARDTLSQMWGARWPADEGQRAVEATKYVLRQHNIGSVDIPTSYMTEAVALDAGRTKKYWSTPWEMFARAFEAYMYDALLAEGGSNSYLVSEQKADGYFADSKWKANPYPTGDERRILNEHMRGYLNDLTGRLGMRRTASPDATVTTRDREFSV